MNKFLLVLLTIILISSSAFRMEAKGGSDTYTVEYIELVKYCFKCFENDPLFSRSLQGSQLSDFESYCSGYLIKCKDLFQGILDDYFKEDK